MRACFFQGVVHHAVAPELCAGVRMPCGSSTMVYPGHLKSCRDLLWPEAMLRVWTTPAPHPSVRARGTFAASTTEGRRLTSPAAQINIISLDIVLWTTHINGVVRLLLAITCLLLPHEVTHTLTRSFGLRDRFTRETWHVAIFRITSDTPWQQILLLYSEKVCDKIATCAIQRCFFLLLCWA